MRRIAAASLLLAIAAWAQTYTINTVAGKGRAAFSGEGVPAATVQLFEPQKVAVDSTGNLYFSDSYFNRVFKVTPAGVISTFAGTGQPGSSGNGGPATAAKLDTPLGLAVDTAGNLYIADAGNNVIRQVSPSGVITTVAGTGTAGASGDGKLATQARLSFPADVAVDSANNLYIADAGNNKIRKVSAGTITTIAGNGTYDYTGDGKAATAAALANPEGVAVDSSGNIYIADQDNEVIRKVTASTGTIATYAGTGDADYTGDNGPATKAALYSPSGVALDTSGNLYIADYDNWRVRKVTPSGTISTFAGNGNWGFSGDGGSPTAAQVGAPAGVAVDAKGNLYIAQVDVRVVREVAGAAVSTVAGTGPLSAKVIGDGGPALSAYLLDPEVVAADAGGNYYIADLSDNRVRKVSASGAISTVAGNGYYNTTGDNGPAGAAQLQAPNSLALDSAGNLYIGTDYAVRKITPTGVISTVAPNGLAQLGTAPCVATDSAGNLYVGDPDNGVVRKVTPAGTASIFAGTVGNSGYDGDGGAANKATLDYPAAVAVDAQGNVYIADYNQSVVRQVTPAGIISTFAGTGNADCTGDGGPAAQASLYSPTGLAVDSAGNVLIADIDCSSIRIVTSDGKINTVAGNGDFDFTGDGGPALSAAFFLLNGIAVDKNNAIYAADAGNFRVRKMDNGQLQPAGVVNAASSVAGPIAPGEMISIYGTNIGPATSATAALNSQGLVSNQLSNTQVMVNGTPAPLIFVSAAQVNAIIPYSVAGQSSVPMQIVYQGLPTNTITLSVAIAAPGLFTSVGSGQGQAAALNQDSSVNSASNPAVKGSVIQLFGTGEGQTTPPGVDGQLATGATIPKPAAPVTVTIDGQPATVLYAGTAPGGVAGFLQVNAQIPAGVSSGSVSVSLTIGGVTSRNGVTMAVR